jgi:hypothetical protein
MKVYKQQKAEQEAAASKKAKEAAADKKEKAPATKKRPASKSIEAVVSEVKAENTLAQTAPAESEPV